MNYSIVVSHVSKAYRANLGKLERFKEWFILGYHSPIPPKWVLQDINFNVNAGESIGIIGMNGAGKSTLLKIVTGTTTPTSGNVRFHGRVAALLELGIGFHPDFTGRQNIAMAGQLAGLTPQEIATHIPDIEAFAEIGGAVDMPIRTYSSGMQMRLAFALATAVRPDILIIDEALSVGDVYFQQKSFKKIRQFREQGTTLLFVSHDKSAVLQLCDRAILLDKGRAVFDGSPAEAMDMYNALIAQKDTEGEVKREIVMSSPSTENTPSGANAAEPSPTSQGIRTISGNLRVEILSTRLLDTQGHEIDCVTTGQSVRLEIHFIAHEDVTDVVFGMLIRERTGMEVFGINTYHLQNTIDVRKGQQGKIYYDFTAKLGPGMYSISVAAHQGQEHVSNNFNWIDLAVTFAVINTEYPIFAGVTWLQCKNTYEFLDVKC